MSDDQRMSEEIMQSALALHIGEALKRENLPSLDADKYRTHLARIEAARERLASEAVREGCN